MLVAAALAAGETHSLTADAQPQVRQGRLREMWRWPWDADPEQQKQTTNEESPPLPPAPPPLGDQGEDEGPFRTGGQDDQGGEWTIAPPGAPPAAPRPLLGPGFALALFACCNLGAV